MSLTTHSFLLNPNPTSYAPSPPHPLHLVPNLLSQTSRHRNLDTFIPYIEEQTAIFLLSPDIQRIATIIRPFYPPTSDRTLLLHQIQICRTNNNTSFPSWLPIPRIRTLLSYQTQLYRTKNDPPFSSRLPLPYIRTLQPSQIQI
jgi:hypothetical protein